MLSQLTIIYVSPRPLIDIAGCCIALVDHYLCSSVHPRKSECQHIGSMSLPSHTAGGVVKSVVAAAA